MNELRRNAEIEIVDTELKKAIEAPAPPRGSFGQ